MPLSSTPIAARAPAGALMPPAANARDERAQMRLQWMLVAALAACVLEGAVRKWLIPDGSPLRYVAYFSKDILLAACILSPARAAANPLVIRATHIITGGVVLTLFAALFGCTGGVNPVGAILTLRSTVVLPLLAVVIAKKLRPDAIIKLCLSISVFTAINAPLGAVQFFSPQGSAINKYTHDMESVATAGYSERVRATGTFSYLTGLGIFSCAAVAAGLILASTQTEKRKIYIGYATVVGGLICAGTTVSRGVAVATIAELVTWLVLSGRVKTLASGLALVIAVIGGLQLFGGSNSVTEILSAAQRRNEVAGDSATGRILMLFIEVPYAIVDAPFGVGLGTQQIGGTFYATGSMAFASYEAEWPRIVMEMGLIGLIGVAITHLGTIFLFASAWRMSRQPAIRTVYLTLAVVCGLWFVGGVVFNHVSSSFFWMFATCGFAVGQTPRPTEGRAVPHVEKARST